MGSARARLCLMMFLEYFVWGSWGVALGGYMASALGFEGWQIGSIYSTTAIAAIVSPLLFGYVADRLMASERLLGILHLVGAALLFYAAQTEEFSILFGVMIAYAFCYMPTLALTNSISFAHIGDPEKEFPLIRVFGTLSWIASGLVVGFILQSKPDGRFYETVANLVGTDSPLFNSNSFFYMAAGTSLLLGLYSFTLPHTPPTPKPTEPNREGRQSILRLLAEPSFLVFVIASFFICIPLAFYYNLANIFLVQTDAPAPTALQTIGQMSEVFFMAVMPIFIVRLGVKNMLAIGMLAWVLRYLAFGSLAFPLVVVGLLLHGICYDFFFVASQIYVDSKADVSQRASAQSFIAFVTLGLGMYVGAYVAGLTYDSYPPVVQVADVEVRPAGADSGTAPQIITTALPDWDPTGKTGLAAAMDLKADSELSPENFPATLEIEQGGKVYVYKQEALRAAALDAANQYGSDQGKLDRTQWRRAQQYQWFYIWLWPAVGAAATLSLFWIGFRDRFASRSQIVTVEKPGLAPARA